MKHSKLWTAMALPLLFAACSNADKDITAGVVATDCMNISGDWIHENGSRTFSLTQDGCSSMTGKEKGVTLTFSTVEKLMFGKTVRAEFTKTHIKIFSVGPVRADFRPNEMTSTIKIISADVLEITEESALMGTPINDPRIDRFFRVKPVQAESPAELPTLELPNNDLPQEMPVTPSTLGLEGVQNQSRPGVSLPGGVF